MASQWDTQGECHAARLTLHCVWLDGLQGLSLAAAATAAAATAAAAVWGCHRAGTTAAAGQARLVQACFAPCRAPSHLVCRSLGLRTALVADANVNNPKEYWDYENLAIDWG